MLALGAVPFENGRGHPAGSQPSKADAQPGTATRRVPEPHQSARDDGREAVDVLVCLALGAWDGALHAGRPCATSGGWVQTKWAETGTSFPSRWLALDDVGRLPTLHHR